MGRKCPKQDKKKTGTIANTGRVRGCVTHTGGPGHAAATKAPPRLSPQDKYHVNICRICQLNSFCHSNKDEFSKKVHFCFLDVSLWFGPCGLSITRSDPALAIVTETCMCQAAVGNNNSRSGKWRQNTTISRLCAGASMRSVYGLRLKRLVASMCSNILYNQA